MAWGFSAFNFETRSSFEVFERDEHNRLRTRDHRTFEGAIENFQARFLDDQGELALDKPVLITNKFASPGDTISPQGSKVPFTLDLTTRLVEDPADGFTLPEEILPYSVKEEPLANLVPNLNPLDDINNDVERRLEYIIKGDHLSNLPDQILEATLIIEDAVGNSHNGFQIFQGSEEDGEFITIIEEEDVTGENPRALNDINFILENRLLGFSESNEENTRFNDEGIVDRVRITRIVEDDPCGCSDYDPYPEYHDPYHEYHDPYPEFAIRSVENEINFQNFVPDPRSVAGRQQFVIEAEDLHLDTYQVENIDIARGGEVISINKYFHFLKNAQEHTGTAELDVDEFGIEPGTYGLVLTAFDENDGEAQLEVFVNDDRVGEPIILDQHLGNDFATQETRRNISIGDIEIDSGDIITIQGTTDMGELARVDYLTFIEVDV